MPSLAVNFIVLWFYVPQDHAELLDANGDLLDHVLSSHHYRSVIKIFNWLYNLVSFEEIVFIELVYQI